MTGLVVTDHKSGKKLKFKDWQEFFETFPSSQYTYSSDWNLNREGWLSWKDPFGNFSSATVATTEQEQSYTSKGGE